MFKRELRIEESGPAVGVTCVSWEVRVLLPKMKSRSSKLLDTRESESGSGAWVGGVGSGALTLFDG